MFLCLTSTPWARKVIYCVLLLALFASCESTDAPLVLYESPHGLVVLKAARVDFAAEDTGVQAALLGNLGQAHQRLGRIDSALVS